MSSMRLKNTQIAVVTDEGGELPVVSALDVIMAENMEMTVKGNHFARDYYRSTMSPHTPLNQVQTVRVSFETELRGTGKNTSAAEITPDCDKLLRACGFKATFSDSGGWRADYTPTSSDSDSFFVMLRIIQDEVLYDVREAVGTFTLDLTAGTYGRFKWEFQGKYIRPVFGTVMSGVNFPSNIPPLVANTDLVLGDYEGIRYSQLTLSPNNSFTILSDANSEFGVKGVRITGRNSGGSFFPEMLSPDDYHFWRKWEETSVQSLSLTVGYSQGNKVNISLPKVYWEAPTVESKGGIVGLNIPYKAVGNDDEILIRYE